MSTGLILCAVAIMVAFLTVIIRLVRARKLRAKYSFTWLVVGVVLIVVAAVPGLIDWIGSAAGVSYPPALLFLGAIVFLLFLAVHFSWELSRLEDRTRTLAEEVALANQRIDELSAAPRRRAMVDR